MPARRLDARRRGGSRPARRHSWRASDRRTRQVDGRGRTDRRTGRGTARAPSSRTRHGIRPRHRTRPRRKPVSYLVLPVTESMASLIALVILDLNTPKMTTTRPAVMTVTMTQPGTSPRSGSRPRTRAYALPTQTASMSKGTIEPSLSLFGKRNERQQTWIQREEHGDRKEHEHDRHHHRDLLAAAGLKQCPPADLAAVG